MLYKDNVFSKKKKKNRIHYEFTVLLVVRFLTLFLYKTIYYITLYSKKIKIKLIFFLFKKMYDTMMYN